MVAVLPWHRCIFNIGQVVKWEALPLAGWRSQNLLHCHLCVPLPLPQAGSAQDAVIWGQGTPLSVAASNHTFYCLCAIHNCATFLHLAGSPRVDSRCLLPGSGVNGRKGMSVRLLQVSIDKQNLLSSLLSIPDPMGANSFQGHAYVLLHFR